MEIVGINDYLASKRARTTKASISTILKDFIRFATSCEKGTEEEHSVSWLSSAPEIFIVLRNYVNYLNTESKAGHLAPMTVHIRFNTVNNWLGWNGISIGEREIAVLQSALPRKIMVGEDACISKSTIQTILHHSDIQMKALILVLCSSGMRINEALGLQYADFAGKKISEIEIPRGKMKAGIAHRYYFSGEALAALSEYLKVRNTIQERSKTRTNNLGMTFSNTTLFGMSATTAGVKFRRIQAAAGVYEYDPEGKQGKITFHSLRKWMESTAKLHQPENIVNALVGHNEGLSQNYRRYTPDQLRDAYAKIEPYLCIEAPAEYAQLQGETQTTLKLQQETTAALAAKMLMMEQELKTLREVMKASEER
jgi:integrase